MPGCPKCQENLTPVLDGGKKPISYMCENKNCGVYNTELYVCTGGLLLTKKELVERRQAEGES